MSDAHQHTARLAIESITMAMSNVAALGRSDSSLKPAAWLNLHAARRALITKYQPEENQP